MHGDVGGLIHNEHVAVFKNDMPGQPAGQLFRRLAIPRWRRFLRGDFQGGQPNLVAGNGALVGFAIGAVDGDLLGAHQAEQHRGEYALDLRADVLIQAVIRLRVAHDQGLRFGMIHGGSGLYL